MTSIDYYCSAFGLNIESYSFVGTIERLEFAHDSKCLWVQEIQESKSVVSAFSVSETGVFGMSRQFDLPENTILDWATGEKAGFLLYGSGSQTGVKGWGTADLSTGLTFWQNSGDGQWILTFDGLYWKSGTEFWNIVWKNGVNEPETVPVSIDSDFISSVSAFEQARRRHVIESQMLTEASGTYSIWAEFVNKKLKAQAVPAFLWLDWQFGWALQAAIPVGESEFRRILFCETSEHGLVDLELDALSASPFAEGIIKLDTHIVWIVNRNELRIWHNADKNDPRHTF